MKAIYDLGKSPVTYDFLSFLVRAERSRRERGDPELEIGIAYGERFSSLRDLAFSYERKQFRTHGLLSQLPLLLPSVTKVTVGDEGVQEFPYSQPLDFEPIFKAPEGAMAAISEYVRFGKPYVTITLRDSDFQPERNSNIIEWVKVADWLEEFGYEVVFVPDSEALMGGKVVNVGGHEVYTPAAFSQSIRLALYEYANLNCFTSGGPLMLSMWSSAPTFACRLLADVESCSKETLTKLTLNPRDIQDQFKWITWDVDDFDLVKQHLERILPVCKQRVRPLIQPKSFSVLTEEQRFSHMRNSMSRGYKTFQPELEHDRTMILVCYGPSLRETAWEIPSIDGDVFTVSGAHDYVVNMGIKPFAHVEADPRPHKALLIKKAIEGTKYYMASCCHPDTIDKVDGMDVILWHPHNSAETDKQVNKLDPNGFVVLGGSNVGLRAMSLGVGLGYRKMVIFGMDCSFGPNGEQHAGAHTGKKQRVMQTKFADGQAYWTSPSMIQGYNDFFKMTPAFTHCQIELKGNGMLQHALRVANETSTQREAA